MSAMELDLPARLIERLDFDAAVAAEAVEPMSYLPSRVAESVVAETTTEVAASVKARVEQGMRILPPELVWAPKTARGRFRPVLSLLFQDRVVLRALVQDLLTVLPPLDRSSDARKMFEEGVLEDPNTAYVVVADVASFYAYVDHAELETQIVEQTAKSDTAFAIRGILEPLFGRTFGLPQNYRPVDRLADLVLAPVERALIRQGLDTRRFNDDFRIGAGTWGGAFRALEQLHSALDTVGLTLNEEKSWILLRDNYKSNLGLSDRLLNEAFQEIEDEQIIEYDPYTGEPIEPLPAGAPEPDFEAVFSRAFYRALDRRLSGEVANTGFEAAALRRVFTNSLGYFMQVSSTAGLDGGPLLLSAEPALMPTYVRYLQRLTTVGRDFDFADQLARTQEAFRGYIPPWPQAWLINAVLDPSVPLTPSVEQWLRSYLSSKDPPALRVRAVLPLAARGLLTTNDVLPLFDQLSVYARADVAAAVGLLDDSEIAVKSVTEADPFYARIVDFARRNRNRFDWL